MARARNWWRNSKNAVIIWLISAIIFCSVYLMALQNTSRNPPLSSPASSSSSDFSERRLRLYDKMARDLDEHGALFLRHGETSQSLSLSDIFALKDGTVTPIPKAANPPVRANVLYLRPEYVLPISKAVRNIFPSSFEKVIWFQNSSLYHFSMFHASHHIAPVPATEEEIEAEANAVKAIAEVLCPLTIQLDRVVLTSTGVLLGCWQVISGTDPVTIRAKLRIALPNAPEKQLYDAAMLHTSFARLLGHPAMEELSETSKIQFFHELVTRLNDRVHKIQATISELWYVEEYDVLALALNGRMKVRKFQLGCSNT